MLKATTDSSADSADHYKPQGRLERSVRQLGHHALRHGFAIVPASALRASRDRLHAGEVGPRQRLVLSGLRHAGVIDDPFTIPGSGGLKLASSDSLLAARLYWFGIEGWEPQVLRTWKVLCERSDRAVEIGANIGYFAVAGASVMADDATYAAYEPHPSSAGVLRENLRLNGLDNVVVKEQAVGASDIPGHIELGIPAQDHYDNPLGATIVSGHGNHEHASTFRVEAVPGGDALAGAQVIKIDAEGAEHEILTAAHDAIEADCNALLLEVLPPELDLHEMVAKMTADDGWGLWELPSNGTPPTRIPSDGVIRFLSATVRSRDLLLARPRFVEGITQW